MPPKPHFGEEIPYPIQTIVSDTRERLLEGQTSSSNPTPQELSDIYGNCHSNSYQLALQFQEADYEPYLVWGGVAATENGSLLINTIDQLERTNRVHFWVEFQPEEIGKPIIADLFSKSPHHYNQIFVDTHQPGPYQTLRDDPSYIRFETSFEPADLVSETSYRLLRKWIPELFYTNPWTENGEIENTDQTSA